MDYSKCKYDVFSVKPGLIKKSFPVFELFDEFSQLDTKIIKYIVACYDKNSPLQQLDDIMKRKIEAAKDAGYTPDKSQHFPDEVEDMMLCRNKKVNKAIVRYCHLQSDMRWAFYVSAMENFYTNTVSNVLTGQLSMISKAKGIIEELETMSTEILMDNNQKLINELENIAVEDYIERVKRLRPETVAYEVQVRNRT